MTGIIAKCSEEVPESIYLPQISHTFFQNLIPSCATRSCRITIGFVPRHWSLLSGRPNKSATCLPTNSLPCYSASWSSKLVFIPCCQYPEGPATGHLDTCFSWFPCVYKRMLRWFPSFQVATTCFSCSPPDLNFLVTFFFIFVYM